MQVRMLRDMFGADRTLYVAGQTYDLADALALSFIGVGAASDVGSAREDQQDTTRVERLTAAQIAAGASGVAGVTAGGGIMTSASTWASMPAAAASAGAIMRVTDLNDSLYISDGTRWVPMNGRAAIFGQNTPTTGFNSTTETVQVAIPIPAGALQDNDYLTVVFAGNKAAGTDTCNFRARLGTSPTVVGTIGQTNTALATTNLQNQCVWRFQRKSATTLDFPMAGAGVQGTQTTARPAAVTVPNMDTQVTYLQLTLQMTTGAAELAAFQYVQAWHESF